MRTPLSLLALSISLLSTPQAMHASRHSILPVARDPHRKERGRRLARQIAEGHGGSLVLANRTDRRGCVARLEFPLA
jgi:hypothetical protein